MSKVTTRRTIIMKTTVDRVQYQEMGDDEIRAYEEDSPINDEDYLLEELACANEVEIVSTEVTFSEDD